MVTEESFLRAILGNPADDAIRLAYADWLTDQGDPRGEFIQLQVALARGDLDPEREAELRERERQLLDEFGTAWAAPLRACGGNVAFHRGLPIVAPDATVQTDHQQLAPVRPPRVRLAYERGSDLPDFELPFVIGVLADLSGARREGLRSLRERPFEEIDRDNFDTVMAQVRPELRIDVPSDGGGQPLSVNLTFERMEDFEPDRLVERIPSLARLVEARRDAEARRAASEELAGLDWTLSSRLAAVMHHADFRRLEATWRGLHHLVHQTETNERLRIRVLNISEADLRAELKVALSIEVDVTSLFAKIYTCPRRWAGECPFGLLIGDYEFSHRPEDVELLQMLAQVGAAAHVPFVAGASPRAFGLERYADASDAGELASRFEGGAEPRWRAFRESPESRYAALALPRVLARSPYGDADNPTRSFRFEERDAGEDRDGLLWMNAAWVFAVRVARAVARHGWIAPIRGLPAGEVEIPARHLSAPGGEVVVGPAEVSLSQEQGKTLAGLGFLSLTGIRGRERAAFLEASSCRDAGGTDDPAARLDYLLCASRFVHFLIMRDYSRMVGFEELEEIETWMNRLLAKYVRGELPEVSGVPPLVAYYRWVLAGWDARKPLAEGHVRAAEIAGKPGCHRITVRLRPVHQLGEPGGTTLAFRRGHGD